MEAEATSPQTEDCIARRTRSRQSKGSQAPVTEPAPKRRVNRISIPVASPRNAPARKKKDSLDNVAPPTGGPAKTSVGPRTSMELRSLTTRQSLALANHLSRIQKKEVIMTEEGAAAASTSTQLAPSARSNSKQLASPARHNLGQLASPARHNLGQLASPARHNSGQLASPARQNSQGVLTVKSRNQDRPASLVLPKVELPAKSLPLVKSVDGIRMKTYSLSQNMKERVAAGLLAVKVPSVGIKIEPPPLHTVSKTVLGWLSLGSHPTLFSRGVNREVTVHFRCDIVNLKEKDVILVRFVKCDGSPENRECHPRNLQIYINDFDVTKLEFIDHKNTKNCQAFNSPIELPREKIIPNNKLFVCWTVGHGAGAPAEDYFLFVEVAERRPINEVARAVSANRLPLQQAISRAFVLLTPDDEGISMNSSVVSLICTLSRKRAQLPVRGKNCRHLECFDAESYCLLNAGSKAKWSCPICKECVPAQDLVVDEFIVDLIGFTQHNQLKICTETDAVVVSEIQKAKTQSVFQISDGSFGDSSLIILD